MSCGVGRRGGSDPTLLWLWRRPAATAPIRPLAWQPPYAVGAALEKAKRQTHIHTHTHTHTKHKQRSPGQPISSRTMHSAPKRRQSISLCFSERLLASAPQHSSALWPLLSSLYCADSETSEERRRFDVTQPSDSLKPQVRAVLGLSCWSMSPWGHLIPLNFHPITPF